MYFISYLIFNNIWKADYTYLFLLQFLCPRCLTSETFSFMYVYTSVYVYHLFGFHPITYGPLKQIIWNWYTRLVIIKGKPSLISDYTTLSVWSYAPRFAKKFLFTGHLCLMGTFFWIFSQNDGSTGVEHLNCRYWVFIIILRECIWSTKYKS